MQAKVLITAPNVDTAVNTLRDSGVESSVFSSKSVAVELNLGLGDEAVTLKGDRVRVVQDAMVAVLHDAEIVEVREA